MAVKRKEPVRLRAKELKNGNKSLYLDTYVNGRRKYEFLKLYLVPEVSPADKVANKNTLRLAQAVQARRIIELQEGRFDLRSNRATSEVTIQSALNLFESEIRGRGTFDAYAGLVSRVRRFQRSEMRLSSIDVLWVEDFRKSLERAGLKQNTMANYFGKLQYFFRWCVQKRFISFSPADGVKGFRMEQTERVYLTIEEVRRLAVTECKYPEVKRAFLFGCLTGLRLSDIERLRWSSVALTENGMARITFRQKKTKAVEYLDINSEATALLGAVGAGSELVFNLPQRSTINSELKRWAGRAGIDKPISFHVSRHTFATLTLSQGVDLYTVSKLLGHADISTTQVYARVLDEAKQEAVNRLPSIF